MSKVAGAQELTHPHSAVLSNRELLQLTGVLKVLAFDENQIHLKTEKGDLTVSGSALHVSTLVLEDGRMTIDGQVDALVYSRRNTGKRLSWRNLFR